jgi:hypothetical protein
LLIRSSSDYKGAGNSSIRGEGRLILKPCRGTASGNRALWLAIAGLVVAAEIPAGAAEPFTVIVLPDTQNYTNGPSVHQEYGLRQTRWIRDNEAALDIKFVMHVGDLQNPGNPYRARTDDIYEPDFSRRTVDTQAEADDMLTRWDRADDMIQILDNNDIPYGIVPGNHDYLRPSGEFERLEPIYYLKHFGPQRYAGKPTFGGSSPADPVLPYAGMNMFHKFQGNGYTFLNIALQFDPNVHDLRWAQKIINRNPGLPTIVTTHAYINNNGYQPGYQNIWDDFVKLNPQIVMTVNGHITGEHRLIDQNIAGRDVHQMLVDFQATEFDGLFQGGGYLRRMEFDTDANIVRVRTYSPNADDLAGNDGFLKDGDSQFNIPISFTERFGLPNGAGIKSSISFRQDVNGYGGARDTHITANDPDATHGDETTAWVDGGGAESHALIRFENLFTANRIPDGAVMDGAELLIRTSDLPDSQSMDGIALHRLLDPWTLDATWDSKGDGISADADDAILAANDTIVPAVRGEFLVFDVTESLAAWAAGAPNYGWALLPGGTNGWRWDTSDAATIANRPMLNVDFRVVPEPSATVLVVLAGVLALGRRRRSEFDFHADENRFIVTRRLDRERRRDSV